MNSELARPALGQVVNIGTFYDARTDTFLSRSLLKDSFPQSIVTTSNDPKTSIETGFQEGLNQKFSRLKIGSGLGASILSGFVPFDGIGRYFDSKSREDPEIQGAIYHTISTTRENLELNSSELKASVAVSSIDVTEATHVVVEIVYGAQTVIVARRWLRPDEQSKEVESRFKAAMEDFHLEPPAHGNTSSHSTDGFEQVSAYGTISGNREIVLSSLQEARTYLDILSTEMRVQGKGEGVPITYRLMPIKMLDLLRLVQVTGNETTTAHGPDSLEKIFDVFDEFRRCYKTVQHHEKLISRYSAYMEPRSSQDMARRINDIGTAENGLRTDLGQVLRDIRKGVGAPDDLRQLLQRYSEGELAPTNLTSVVQINSEKMAFIEKAVRAGATYIGYDSPDLERSLRQSGRQDAYVLFFSDEAAQDQTLWTANQDIFMKKLQDPQNHAFNAIVDCDAIRRPLSKAAVVVFEDGQEVINDLLEEEQYVSQNCYALCPPSSLEEVKEKPLGRRFVKIACPGRNCASDEVCDWRCSKCDAPLEYGFSDQYIYCDCGRALYDLYEFKCKNIQHGSSFVRYDKSELLAHLQSLDQSNYLNILILGETGVGKSTFINAFVNYLYFDSLDEALKNDGLEAVIPCSFSIQTMDRTNPGSPIVESKIKVGTRDDERDGSTGQSATQKTQVYPITVGSWTYRLIDTPGIGDTRGLDFDKQNMIDILATVSGYEYLHGIIILLRSNNARLTIHFAFCVKELLTHLHRDATNNVVFGFTNTRISNYMPGDTYGSLKSLLSERPDIGLSLASNSAYCFDSESFRYLAAAKQGVIMENKKDFDSSWERSSDEARRMLDYFITKEPHSVKSTTSLNGTRNLIKELTKPMAEISNLIRKNIDLTQDQMQELQNARLTGDELKSKLYPDKLCLEKVDLDKPRTVCSGDGCVEYKNNGEGDVWADYPKPCHPVCYLDNVQPDVIADPALIRCWAFQGNELCLQCQHSWMQHLHLLYELQEVRKQIEDLGIKQQLVDHATDLELKKMAIKQRKELVAEYRDEHKKIQEAAAKFGVFMKENSILPYNDATLAYLDVMIEDAQAKVDVGGGDKLRNTVAGLQEDKRRHIELVKTLEESMQGKGSSRAIHQDEVNRTIQQLFNLKHFGENLEELQTDIAGTLARTNRENPHRVRGRARRGGFGRHQYHASSGTHHGRSQNVLVKRNSSMRPGMAAGTMRVNQPSQSVVIRQSAMPGSFNSNISPHQFPPVPRGKPQAKKSSGITSWFSR